jgi:ribosomal protein L16 Arg81 hydroxylase
MSAFEPASLSHFEAAYPEKAVTLRHALQGHPLLSLEALVELASALPPESVEYNEANLPIGVDPATIQQHKLSITETIQSIRENGSWMVLKRIEQDPDYARLLSETLSEIEPLLTQKTGEMLGQEGFIFISSPGAVTPFHFDPEHNILMQIQGSKTMTVFPAGNEVIVKAEAEELFHRGEHHRNQPWKEEFAALGQANILTPGDALYVPVKAPHWVKNGPEVSISLSVTWRSEWSYEEAYARGFNHLARAKGLNPKPPARYPARNIGKSLAYRVLKRAGLG